MLSNTKDQASITPGIKFVRVGSRALFDAADVDRWAAEPGRQEASRLGLECAAMAAGIDQAIHLAIAAERQRRLQMERALLVIASSVADTRGPIPELIAGTVGLPFPLRRSDIEAKLAELRAEIGLPAS